MASSRPRSTAGQPGRFSRLRRFARNGVLTVVALLATGALFERYCEVRDYEHYAAKETFADVGGARVRYRLLGADQPGAPVVFLSGMIGSTEQYEPVQARVASFAPTLAYDRGGTGFSSGASAYDAGAQAEELSALLPAVGLNRPVIVVGYSSSASIARVFAARHPQQVAGVVLLEPTLLEFEERVPTAHSQLRTYARTMLACSFYSAFGVRRVLNLFGFLKFEPPARTLSDFRAQAILHRFSHWWAVDREVLADAVSRRAVFEAPIIAGQPLVVFWNASPPPGDPTFPVYAQLLHEFVAPRHGQLKDFGAVKHEDTLISPVSIGVLVDELRELGTHSLYP